jgi:hypothetical protein
MSHITLDELRIASPCTSPEWAELKGEDDRARFCLKCDKHVYNLSLMTLDEANDLIQQKEGKLCATLYRRFDGTVLMGDCPVGLRAIRRSYLKTRAKAIALALSIWGFITGTTSSCNMSTVTGVLPVSPNFTADINGTKWENSTDGINDTTINEIKIGATTLDNKSLWIFLDSTERAPGTYTNHRGIFPAGGYYELGKPDTNYWYTGELKITDFSLSHASGTFHFNATRPTPGGDTVIITNGSFNVSLIYGKIVR